MTEETAGLQAQYLKRSMQQELNNILAFWANNTIDETNGGFTGRITGSNTRDPFALKGAVLNTRILWTFSAACRLLGAPQYRSLAARAWEYIRDHFIDQQHGGLYWTVDYTGRAVDTKKQVYAIAFGVYACSEYYKATGDAAAREMAVSLYHDIRTHARDHSLGGYFEAFTADWQPIADQRLSQKDANEKKSMNTHLHVLEAWTTLYEIWPQAQLLEDIQELLDIFSDKIISGETHHLLLFFSDDWQVKGDTVSYGHDIEAAWLLLEAATVTRNEGLINKFKNLALQLTAAAQEGIDSDGGLWYEYEPQQQHLVKEKHWWPQAEAVVGFINAWQITQDAQYLQLATRNWAFIQQFILDKQNGEWHWGVDANGHPLQEDKVGLWKCPYHNGRACMQIMERI
ncbi:AGE family epimerase/isomerase [Chitinophaga sp.]|uniref:AGE family epimerase/isomerase n=1 Tax=Chitinophaga sp. TaxID=1869181 RepID=UPI002DB58179|nr:AGE family epimerase/isomerase [Chitinophaga sp.]